ncbi:enoyl-CoA hydratase [Granulosicoccus antarcticus]|uniref:Enoyl-CoA hydratase domain-containing protein 3, mitochondrial n=1 Tax=Granulosicoccus antarcticus IMCC3135 TaxID=1192854 RepID=A0A2Z2NY94_9GAMM|nr:enoyl-CoA hydratase [Granulosicoccus antarcticus]ASJ75455.1 Enoyl-CoA-hydratase [Granulosicoccus antarcticus IMCC3135]
MNQANPSSESPLLLEQLDSQGILTLTLNRPKQFNALSEAMLDALQSALHNVDERVRVIVIAASGKAFCAGHDLREMRSHVDEAQGGERWQRELFDKCCRFMQTLTELPQPVIARVQGLATAAGCQLVANCDLAVAADHCQFGVSGVNLGLFCSTPSVALSRNLSRKRAFQMLVTGEFINAETALDWGLINRHVPDEQLDAAISVLCEQICKKSQVAIATGKTLFYKQLESPLAEAYALASEAMACNMMSEDASEGIDAFFDKREPQWKHR